MSEFETVCVEKNKKGRWRDHVVDFVLRFPRSPPPEVNSIRLSRSNYNIIPGEYRTCIGVGCYLHSPVISVALVSVSLPGSECYQMMIAFW